MPKRGALNTWSLRSNSPGLPVSSACTGASKPRPAAEAGTSCTSPSVIMTTPASRSGGTSASACARSVNSMVPSRSLSAEVEVELHPAHVEIGEGLEPLLQFLAQLGGARGAAGDRLALAVVDHHGEHVVERLAVLLLQLRIGDGEQQQRVAQQPEDGAAARAPEQQREQHGAQARRAPTAPARARRAGTRSTSSWRHCPNRSSRAGTCT